MLHVHGLSSPRVERPEPEHAAKSTVRAIISKAAQAALSGHTSRLHYPANIIFHWYVRNVFLITSSSSVSEVFIVSRIAVCGREPGPGNMFTVIIIIIISGKEKSCLVMLC